MFVFIVTIGFSQCVSSEKVMKITDTIQLSKESLSKVYYQHWVAGVRGGGSGTNLYVSKSAVGNKQLVSAYFKGKVIDFDPLIKGGNVYVAYFKGTSNLIHDIKMHSDTANEYGNNVPPKKKEFPFKLEANEAIISYLENDEIRYLKLTNIPEKESLAYPSAPRN